MSLGTNCFSPLHKPFLTKQTPRTGTPALLVAINIVFPRDASAFLPEDEVPRIFGSPLFSVPCYQGAASDQGRTLLPRYCGKGFPNIALEETLKSPEDKALSQLLIL